MAKHPSRIMTPWYDSMAICLMGLIIMVAVFLFAIIGVSVAYEREAYHRHMFIPLILMLVSLGGLVIFSLKLARQSSPKKGG